MVDNPWESADDSDVPEEVRKQWFRKDGSLNWPEKAQNQKSMARVRDASKLEEIVPHQHKELIAFVRRLLTVNPDKRPSARDMLSDPFFDKIFEERVVARGGGRR